VLSNVKSTYKTSSGSGSSLWFYKNCYPVKCGILFAQVGLAVSSGGNPWAVAMAIGSARQIID
jgi:hypothetical protein